MGSLFARSIMGFASVAVVVAAFGASAAPILVDFESDTVPTSVVGDFTSQDPNSQQVLFRDSEFEHPLDVRHHGWCQSRCARVRWQPRPGSGHRR